MQIHLSAANKCIPRDVADPITDIKPNIKKLLSPRTRIMCKLCRIVFRTAAQVEMHNENFKEQHASIIAYQNSSESQLNSSNQNGLIKKRFRSCHKLFAKPCEPIGDIPLTNEVIRKNKYTLQQIFECHSQSNEGFYTCKVCGKTLKSRNTFIMHLKRRHTCTYEAFCDSCERGFIKIADYEVHLEKHKNDTIPQFKLETIGNYKCEKCLYQFKTVSFVCFILLFFNLLILFVFISILRLF